VVNLFPFLPATCPGHFASPGRGFLLLDANIRTRDCCGRLFAFVHGERIGCRFSSKTIPCPWVNRANFRAGRRRRRSRNGIPCGFFCEAAPALFENARALRDDEAHERSFAKRDSMCRERVSEIVKRIDSVLGRPGSDLLFQVLRLSTIGAGEFNGRVRDGIGFLLPARTTRPAKDGIYVEASWSNGSLREAKSATRNGH
jgi:hypothetical protein